MSRLPVAALRAVHQLLGNPRFSKPADVVRWFGAMQGQEYLSALWALGQRTKRATERTIEDALDDGSVIRTHAFRYTWQLIAREDVRWMLDLVGARVIARGGSRFRALGLDAKTLIKCHDVLARALEGGNELTRTEMTERIACAKLPTAARHSAHVFGHAELSGVICSGGRRGKQSTFALLDDRVPPAKTWSRDRAVTELARRYFQSRGPATVDDFVWWTGLTKADARAGIEALRLASATLDGQTHWFVESSRPRSRGPRARLLPAFDEYLVGYRDRSAFLAAKYRRRVNAGGGMLKPAVVLDGQVIGTWKRVLEKDRVAISIETFERPSRPARDAIVEASDRYAAFVELPARVTFG